MKSRLKIFECAALVALCAALCTGTWAQGRQQRLSSNLVRLHILAHSDSDEEQQIKLDVRDAVLACLEPLLTDSESRTQTEKIIASRLDYIARVASSAAQGRKVRVSLGTESYPTRSYRGFALPAGEYRSLRIELGDAAGQNWWCVVFPPLCTQAVSQWEACPALSSEDLSLITGASGYTLGFRSVELWGLIRQALDSD